MCLVVVHTTSYTACVTDSFGATALSPATTRFRTLVLAFLAPTEDARLMSYRPGEAQLQIERPGKAPVFYVILDGAREEERSLRLRVGRFATENVKDQHVVLVANHPWMAEALNKLEQEFQPKLHLYQLSADGERERMPKRTDADLLRMLASQAQVPVPADGGPLGGLTDDEFSAKLQEADAEKGRLAEKLVDRIKGRLTPVALAMAGLPLLLFGLKWFFGRTEGNDPTTVIVQLGANLPALVRQGDYWRLFSAGFLHIHPAAAALTTFVVLALGTSLEKLIGSVRLLLLLLAASLAGSLASAFLPVGGQAVIRVSGTALGFGLLGALPALAFFSRDLPAEYILRLRKLIAGGVIFGVIAMLIPGIDRVANGAALLASVLLTGTGAIKPPPMKEILTGTRLPHPALLAAAAVLGIVSAVGLLASLGMGHAWQPDRSWKARLVPSKAADPSTGLGVPTPTTGTESGKQGAQQSAAVGPVVRRPLGDSGASIELPESLGEVTGKPNPPLATVYEAGDLVGQQQALAIVATPAPKKLKKANQKRQIFDQALAQVRHDHMSGPGVTELSPIRRSEISGWPTAEMHVRMTETVQARGIVQVRAETILVLWYRFTDLLPESVQLDLNVALASFRSGSPSKADKPRKTKRH